MVSSARAIYLWLEPVRMQMSKRPKLLPVGKLVGTAVKGRGMTFVHGRRRDGASQVIVAFGRCSGLRMARAAIRA